MAADIPRETQTWREVFPIRLPEIRLRLRRIGAIIGLYQSRIPHVNQARGRIHKDLAPDALQEPVLVEVRNIRHWTAVVYQWKHGGPTQPVAHVEAWFQLPIVLGIQRDVLHPQVIAGTYTLEEACHSSQKKIGQSCTGDFATDCEVRQNGVARLSDGSRLCQAASEAELMGAASQADIVRKLIEIGCDSPGVPR